MRAGIAMVVALLLLTGCNTSDPADQQPSIAPETAASIDTSSGIELYQNVASLEQADAAGHTPEQAVLALVDAANASQWEALYSMYATPTPSLEVAMSEWAHAQEEYRDFTVVETRVTAPDAAFVRVVYRVQATPIGGSARSIDIQEPGEWWPLHKVDGLWRVQWMPRQ